ncbi:MAG: VOC family protein [Rhizobiales bacterium]|nr:VOC family protein [Hyphomicrobiales bacterium]MBI3674803.1 VOC family protein [Hyphomicrobiales bacterium]
MASITAVTYLVRDYDEAIAWFVHKLGFNLVEDTALGCGKCWVTVEPNGGGSRLLLARAEGAEQLASIGKAAGGRVAFFLQTDDFGTDHAAMQERGVKFREAPRHEAYGTVAVFEDLYGNGWDLVEVRRQ